MEPSTVAWLESYLDRQSTLVDMYSVLSSPHFISAGVAKGTRFVRVLFLVCINNLPNTIN